MKVAPLRTSYRRLARREVGGKRKSGFGLLHDGSEDDIFSLLSRRVFQSIARDAKTKRMLQRFVEAFDTGTAPGVGYSYNVDSANATSTEVAMFMTLMTGEHAKRNIDFAAHGTVDGRETQLLWDGASSLFAANVTGLSFTRSALTTKLQQGQAALTFVGVPPGSGRRFALDRDRDGVLDGDEAAKPYGASSPACSTMRLRANSVPEVAHEGFALVVENSTPNGSVLMMLGASKANVSVLGIDLLVDLTNALLVSVPSDVRGTAVLPLPIPNDAALRGVKVYGQGFAFEACAAQSLGASNGLEIVVQR